jgi:hypothetical protein
MSYTYLLEQGEEYSAASFSDIPPSVLSKLNLTAERSYCKDNETASCQSSQSGVMFAPSTANLGAEKSMWSAEDSLAKTSQVQERELESQESEADYGIKWPESLAKYNRNSRSWRTAQCLLFEDLGESLETFPNWGMMQDGECWGLAMSAHLIEGIESGLWPTPQRVDYKGTSRNSVFQQRAAQYEVWSMGRRDYLTIYPNPTAYEAIMGWLIQWTELKPLATDKFRLWLQQHSVFLATEDEMT